MADLLLRQSGMTEPLLDHGGTPASALASGSPVLAFTLIDTRASFEALGPEWNALFDRAGRPEQVFQTFGWNWHWCRHYLGRRLWGRRLAVVTGRLAGELVLVMPLVLERRAGLKQLVWMGEPVSQYGDVVAAPEAANLQTLEQAWQFAVRVTRADVANLRKVRADAVAAPLMAQIGAVVTATEEAPYLDFRRAQDLASYEAGLSAKGRKNRRRHMRRLSERGPVAFADHEATDDAARLAGFAVLMKRAWLKSRDRISLAMTDDRFLGFFADVAQGREHRVPCKVLELRSCNEVAALEVVLECKGVRFLHIAVYGLKFDKCGAGGLLLEHSLTDCFTSGMTRLDLLAPRHEYKMEFADGTVQVRDHAVALTLAGRAYTSGYLGMRRQLKAAVEAMPAPARRAFASAVGLLKGRGG